MAGVKGKSGKKLDSMITDALRLAMLREAADPAHKNRVHAMAEEMAKRAEQGDMTAVVYVTERLEGKPTQHNENHVEVEISEKVKRDAESVKSRIVSFATRGDTLGSPERPN